ncbi:MAG: ABC transporter ATP-binding protein, partial [Candidatus Latescibacterota bacterium]
MALAIEARGLGRAFGPVEAVRELDLEVGSGEMLGLVGPDGAGKTTTLRLLAGILVPSQGRAQVLGLDLQTRVEAIKRRIGYLAQQFSLYGDLTVDENIEFFARIHDVRQFARRRNELLEFTRLGPFRRRLAEHLSGGMKKKLALACTLIHRPELILLDEPTTGVDPVSRR